MGKVDSTGWDRWVNARGSEKEWKHRLWSWGDGTYTLKLCGCFGFSGCWSLWRAHTLAHTLAHTQTHTLISVFIDYHLCLFLFFCSFSLPSALFASVHKQINLPSTCWRWAWLVRGILSVMNRLSEGEGCWRMCWKGGMGNTVAPFQLRRCYQTAVLITNSLERGVLLFRKNKNSSLILHSFLCKSSSTPLLSKTDEITVFSSMLPFM